eukprot:5848957-Pyramimonas_sp.AAC.1
MPVSSAPQQVGSLRAPQHVCEHQCVPLRPVGTNGAMHVSTAPYLRGVRSQHVGGSPSPPHPGNANDRAGGGA